MAILFGDLYKILPADITTGKKSLVSVLDNGTGTVELQLLSTVRLPNPRKVGTLGNFAIPKAQLYWIHNFGTEESKPTLVFPAQCLYS